MRTTEPPVDALPIIEVLGTVPSAADDEPPAGDSEEEEERSGGGSAAARAAAEVVMEAVGDVWHDPRVVDGGDQMLGVDLVAVVARAPPRAEVERGAAAAPVVWWAGASRVESGSACCAHGHPLVR